MNSVSGKVAVVTGAGSGIGRALAIELARRGARVAITDVNEAGLEGTVATIGAGVHHQTLDVADRDAFETYATAVAEHFGVIHQLYNNAGIAFARPVLESEYADYERVFAVNLWGVIHGTKACLPHLVASGDGHLVNVSSLNGYMAQDQMTHYCTSKFAVRGFTESVRAEMLAAGLPVQVSSVHPGGIKTNIANAAFQSARDLGLPVTEVEEKRRDTYNEKLLKMGPAEAAKIIVGGVEAGRPRILVGNDAKLVDAVVRLLPARYLKLAVAMDKRLNR
jgi:NAD(P)-dependent dehydrogenase (short-subunit alcohol dehydrogenase family)